MTGYLPLHRLLRHGRPAATPLALRGSSRLDFADFATRCAEWHAGFAAIPGARVALFFEDSFEFACALFGAWHAGKTVFLPADTLPHTLAPLTTQVNAWAGDFGPAVAGLRPMPIADARIEWNELDPAAAAVVLFTSGSTGQPTAIVKRLAQLFDEVAALEAQFGARIGPASVWATVSHQHIYGLLTRVLWPLAAARPFAAQRLAYPEEIVAALTGPGAPAVLVASPAHLKRLPNTLDWPAVQGSLCAVFSSGGPLPESALPDCHRLLGMTPIELFGSSETGGVAWRQRHPDPAADATPWRPLPGVEISINDETLELRSPHLASGNWEACADRVSAAGPGFHLLGRADRIVKVEEKRVSLDAIESALLASEWVTEARALVLDDGGRGLAVVAVPSERGKTLLAEASKRALVGALRTVLADVVEASAAPRRFRFPWVLPSNAQGKTTAAALAALFDRRHPEAHLLEREAHHARLRLTIARDLPHFDGHFPATPILPGVAQVDFAIALGRELFALPPRFLRLESLKFHSVIIPDSRIELELDFDAALGRLDFRFGSARARHSSGRIIFGHTP